MISADKKRVVISLDIGLVEFFEEKAWLEKMTKSEFIEKFLEELKEYEQRTNK